MPGDFRGGPNASLLFVFAAASTCALTALTSLGFGCVTFFSSNNINVENNFDRVVAWNQNLLVPMIIAVIRMCRR